MRKFIFRVGLFIMILGLIAAGLELFVRGIPNSYKYKDNWMKIHGSEIETLILGSSVALADIIPSEISNSFSLANSDQGLEYDDFLLHHYIRYCSNLRNVIMIVDDSNLYYDKDYIENSEGFGWYRGIYYKVYMGYNKHPLFSKYSLELSNPMSLRNKLSNYFIDNLGKGVFPIDSLGAKSESYDNTQPKGLDNRDVENYLISRSHMTGLRYNKAYVESIVDLCRERDLRLILLSCPKWHALNNRLDKEKLNCVRAFCDSLCKKHSNVEYYDYLNDERFVGNSDLFRDINHMTHKGGVSFSKVLNIELF